MSFNRFILEKQYQKVKGLGDRLVLMKEQIDWNPFIPLVQQVFHDNKKNRWTTTHKRTCRGSIHAFASMV
jgi:hypothetical protein